jgi:hypothetical protein
MGDTTYYTVEHKVSRGCGCRVRGDLLTHHYVWAVLLAAWSLGIGAVLGATYG